MMAYNIIVIFTVACRFTDMPSLFSVYICNGWLTYQSSIDMSDDYNS